MANIQSTPLDADFTIVMKKMTNSTLLGSNKEHFEKLLGYLREEPKYLTQVALNLPFKLVDEFTDILAGSLYSEFFLVKEELSILSLIRVCRKASD